MELNKEELLMISAGGLSGTLLNAIVRGINAVLDLGRSLGTAIRRIGSNNICPL